MTKLQLALIIFIAISVAANIFMFISHNAATNSHPIPLRPTGSGVRAL